MGERKHTIVCIFDPKSPRITAFNIHEWISETLQLEQDDLSMIQIDGPRRLVYIKFSNLDKMKQIVSTSRVQYEYKHENCEISKVHIEQAGMGIRNARIANLPPEVSDSVITNELTKYGEIKDITEEKWSRIYRYPVSNGIKLVTMNLRGHIPSYISIGNTKVMMSYEGQPVTCYGCNSVGHQFIDCPQRKYSGQRTQPTGTITRSDVVQQNTHASREEPANGINTQGNVATGSDREETDNVLENIHKEDQTIPIHNEAILSSSDVGGCCVDEPMEEHGREGGQPSQAKPSQAKPSQAKPSQAKPRQAKPKF
jgi:hypothetical protein